MRLPNLQARRKCRRLPGDGASRLESHIALNHSQREFEALEPNRKWVADFTYIWTAERWLYAAAVRDLFKANRQLFDERQHSGLDVRDAVLMAL